MYFQFMFNVLLYADIQYLYFRILFTLLVIMVIIDNIILYFYQYYIDNIFERTQIK